MSSARGLVCFLRFYEDSRQLYGWPVCLHRLHNLPFAAVVDPSGRVAAVQGINHFVFVHMEIEGVIGIGRIMGVAVLRLVPADDFTHIFKQGLAFGKVLQGKHTFAVDARTAHLHAAA